MKRAAWITAVLSIVSLAAAQNTSQAAPQQPAAGSTAQTTSPQGTTPPPTAKRPPQAQTQPEYDAWKAADAAARPTTDEQAATQKTPADAGTIMNSVAARTEKAADDFATKFPESELRIFLYKAAMRNYRNVRNLDKTEATGRKVLTFDADDPEALVTVAEAITEKTRDTDLDKDQRYDEAMKFVQKATQTVDTDVTPPAGASQEQVEQYKSGLRSQAYSIMGTIEFKKENFAAAQANLQKSIDAFPSQPDAVDILRLALSLDKQKKYSEALPIANRAVELTQETSQVGTLARRERDRLQQLTAGAPAQPPAQPPKN